LSNENTFVNLGITAEDFARMLKQGGWPTPPAVVSFAGLCNKMDELVKLLPKDQGHVLNFNAYIGSGGFFYAGAFTRYHSYVQLQRLIENKAILTAADKIAFERALTGTKGSSVTDVRIVRKNNTIIEIETKAGDDFFNALTGETNFVIQCSNSLQEVGKVEDYKVFLRPTKVSELSTNTTAFAAAKTKVINAWKSGGLLDNEAIQGKFKTFFKQNTNLDEDALEMLLTSRNDWFESIFIKNISE
jgi:hypothetical protein